MNDGMLQKILNTLPQRVFWKDRNLKYLGCNETFAHDAGLASAAQIIGKTDFDLDWRENAEDYRKADAEILNGSNEKIGFEEPQVRKSGEVAWLRTSKVKILDENGSIIGILGTYEDITEHKRNSLLLRIGSNAHENAVEGVIILDTDYRAISTNHAFTHISGYSSEEVVGRVPTFLRSGRDSESKYTEAFSIARKHGRWTGEFWRKHKSGVEYLISSTITAAKDEASFVTHYVISFLDISKAKQDERRLAFLAFHDPLTELPNRRFLERELSRSLEAEKKRFGHRSGTTGILFIDLDRFKPVNDLLGHAVGDAVLQTVATRLSTVLRKADVLARVGGDEFVIMLQEGNTEALAKVAQKILVTLEKPIFQSGSEIFISGTIGISISGCEENNPEMLLNQADIAMYEAKQRGGNGFQFFDDSMVSRTARRSQIMAHLHSALANSEFELHYQPKIDAVTGSLMGADALLRWHSPELGPVSPLEFIPLAEELGTINEIGDWVLRTACDQAVQWRMSGLGDISVSVNVLPRQFQTSGLISSIKDTLSATALPPNLLEIKITESMSMSNPEKAIVTIWGLRGLGVSVAIDDFGTGRCSLAYLKRFPVTSLKIDKSFIKDIPKNASDCAITKGIIALAKNLGLRVIADGVETDAQLKFLQQANCDEVQGFLLGRPVPNAEFEAQRRAGQCRTVST